MSELNWEKEVNATSRTPRDVLLRTLDEADDIEHVLVIAAFKEGSRDREDEEMDFVVRSDTQQAYIRMGLIDFANLLRWVRRWETAGCSHN